MFLHGSAISFKVVPISTSREIMEEKMTVSAMKDNSVIWTVHDVALYLRMSESKVYRLVKEKRIPVIRLGKTWRFRKDLLDKWLSQSAELSMEIEGQ